MGISVEKKSWPVSRMVNPKRCHIENFTPKSWRSLTSHKLYKLHELLLSSPIWFWDENLYLSLIIKFQSSGLIILVWWTMDEQEHDIFQRDNNFIFLVEQIIWRLIKKLHKWTNIWYQVNWCWTWSQSMTSFKSSTLID